MGCGQHTAVRMTHGRQGAPSQQGPDQSSEHHTPGGRRAGTPGGGETDRLCCPAPSWGLLCQGLPCQGLPNSQETLAVLIAAGFSYLSLEDI